MYRLQASRRRLDVLFTGFFRLSLRACLRRDPDLRRDALWQQANDYRWMLDDQGPYKCAECIVGILGAAMSELRVESGDKVLQPRGIAPWDC
jgi:hypothetical protein